MNVYARASHKRLSELAEGAGKAAFFAPEHITEPQQKVAGFDSQIEIAGYEDRSAGSNPAAPTKKAYRALGKKDFFLAGANSIILDFTPAQYLEIESPSPFNGIPALEPGIIPDIKNKRLKAGLEPVLDGPDIRRE
jgi:hypothetical protein